MSSRSADVNWFECTVSVVMLGASAAVGIYHGFIKKSKGNVEEYMLGGRKMPILPVACSIASSFLSGITLIGFPAEIFQYGTQQYAIVFGILFSALFHFYFVLPVVYNLQITSLYEYLERRFDKHVRKLASVIFTFNQMLVMPAVLYIPALAFNQVSGLPVFALALLMAAVCVFYTSLGGYRAVIWTDTLQSIFTMFTVCTILIIGVMEVGGIGNVYEVANKGERLELFNFDLDPMTRNTLYAATTGALCHYASLYSTHPSTYQRFASMKTYKNAQILVWMMAGGIILVKTIVTLIGLVIYAKYHDCDPSVTKQVSKPGQIFPYFVLDVASKYPGIPGIFLSGVISTALSTLSTSMNTLSGTIYEDIISPLLCCKLSGKRSNLVMKLLVVVFGFLFAMSVIVVQRLGSILQASLSLIAMLVGVDLVIFILGILFPWTNATGAIVGGLTAAAISFWISFNAQYAIAMGQLKFPPKLTTLDGCPANTTFPDGITANMTFGTSGYGSTVVYSDDLPWIYRISFHYYAAIGCIVGIIVGLTVSFITGPQKLEELDPLLIAPQVRFLLKPSRKAVQHPSRDQTEPALYKLVPIENPQTENQLDDLVISKLVK